VIVIMLVFSLANGIYVQAHLNSIWDRAATVPPPAPSAMPPPSMPPPPVA
jgi:hypothetical protein